MINRHSKIYVAGHTGLVGSAIMRCLQDHGFTQLITRTHQALDLTQQAAVNTFFAQEQPEYVFLAAAKVGGIYANSMYPAEFIRDNLLIQNNIIDAAYQHGTQKLLFLGSSCIYPKYAPQPMPESCLLTGALEPTNEWYAVAKIVGIKLCQAYRQQYGFDAIAVMPTNLYGIHDNFHPQHSHVLPALIRRFHEAKCQGDSSVTIWGTGQPRREFLYADDLAEACLFLMQQYSSADIVNIGVGKDITIYDLAMLIKEIVGYQGELVFDASKPDGTPQKLLDVSRLTALGWQAKIDLKTGIQHTYDWFCRVAVSHS
jgi:GDP-L-fucose synthase